MMADVLDANDEQRGLLINEPSLDRQAPPRLSRALLVVGAAHTCVALSGLIFWLVVVGNSQDLDTEVVPAAWLLLAAIFAVPVTLNLACVAWRQWRTGRARDAEFALFRNVWALRVTCGAAVLGVLCSAMALSGALMGQEESAAASAGVHVLTCFTLALVCAGMLGAMPEEGKTTNLFRKMEERPALHRRVLTYALLAMLIVTVVFALVINGSAAFRLFSRGYVFRHDKPHSTDYFRITDDGRMYYLACRGAGAGPDSDVVVLMDADLASSSYGWSWLTPSLSNLWTTCVFDRPGYGWSSEGPPPRTVTRETDDLLLALQAAGRNNSRYVYIAHGLSTWNALMFYRRMPNRVVSMVFIDPFDPRMQLDSDSQERERLSFVNAFGFFGMLVNAFGFLRPVFRLMTYFRPAFDLPGRVLGLFIDSISRQAFWSTIVAENAVLAQSGNETLTAFPFQSYALGSLPVALWCRERSQSWAYFATLSTDTIQVNMTEDMTHFFIFHKRYADQIVTVASDVISMGLNSQQ